MVVVSAERYAVEHRKVGVRGQEGSSWQTTQYAWTPKPEALARLGQALTESEWTSLTEYTLYGDSWLPQWTRYRTEWIDCDLADGSMVRLSLNGSEGQAVLDSTLRFRMTLPKERTMALVEADTWAQVSVGEDDAFPEFQERDRLRLRLASTGIKIRSSLSHAEGVVPAGLVHAQRFQIRRSDSPASGTEEEFVGWAFGKHLLRLEDVVQGPRFSTLRHDWNGKVRLPVRDEIPREKILCRMTDGQDIEIHIYSSDGAWCVVGEDGFRLALWGMEPMRILEAKGWHSIKEEFPKELWPYRCDRHGFEMGFLRVPVGVEAAWSSVDPEQPHSIFYGDTATLARTVPATEGFFTLLSCPGCESAHFDPESRSSHGRLARHALRVPRESAGICSAHAQPMQWIYAEHPLRPGVEPEAVRLKAPNDPLLGSFEKARALRSSGSWRSACSACVGALGSGVKR